MKKTSTLIAVVAVLASAPRFAAAQEEISATGVDPATPPAETEIAARADQPETIKAIVRGLYVEARVGGGLMLAKAGLSRELQDRYPQAGSSEDLGGGAVVNMAVGYDLTDMLALQAVGGLTLVGGGGTGNLDRDLSLAFGGAGARLAFGITNRLHFLAEAGVGYVSASDSVKTNDTQLGRSDGGVAALAGVGVEYFVHIRHFSLGVDLSILAPFSPFRLFVGITPTVKYTF